MKRVRVGKSCGIEPDLLNLTAGTSAALWWWRWRRAAYPFPEPEAAAGEVAEEVVAVRALAFDFEA